MTRYRRHIREVQINRRHGALSARERKRIKVYLYIAAGLVAGAQSARKKREKDVLGLQAAMLCALVCHMRIDRTELPPSVRADPISVADISETDAWTDYRCRKADFPRLFIALGFPQRWACRNGSKFPGEAAFLLLIYRLRYPNRLTDLQERFGRDYTQLSRIFNEVVDWMWQTHRHRLVDYLEFYEPHFAEMAAKIEEKGGIACRGVNIVGFLDGTLGGSCPSGGPRELQHELFDGHDKDHGLAYQSVVFPNGMIGDLYAPSVGRRHDASLLQESKLNERLARVQEKNDTQYKLHGDAAYPITSHVDRGFRGMELNETQKTCNRELLRLRVSAEWMFGKVAAEYAFVDLKKNVKVRKQAIAKYYYVAALLTNARTCLYGSATGSYFGVAAPSLEDYFA